MKLDYSLSCASGPALTDCHFLAHRVDPRAKDDCDSFVMRVRGDQIDPVIGRSGRYQDLWRAPSGSVFVGSADAVHWSSNPVQGGEWRDQSGVVGYGVWGLSEDLVLAWGDPQGETLHRFDGETWHELAAPGWIHGLHGVGPDLVIAVGSEGITRLVEGAWQPLDTAGEQLFTSVFVVSADEIYAIHDRKQVWRGSLAGWQPLTEARGVPALTCVACWGGKVWVGDSYAGLSVVQGEELKVVKESLRPQALDVRGALIVTHESGVSRSQDGAKFGGFKTEALEPILGHVEPKWLLDD